MEYLYAAFLGVIEGLTEFIPVSSTGHLVVIAQWIGFRSQDHVFEVFIQLGAILAVVVAYREKFLRVALDLPREEKARRFALNIILASLPALVVGALAHSLIKDLYTPPVIGCSLILGGVLILLLEKKLQKNYIAVVDDIPPRAAFGIGCVQVLALIPGVSRSGATIMGGLGLGLSRAAAAEFSFFVAIPVMCAAVAFDVYKNREGLMAQPEWGTLAVGFIVSFLVALAVLKLAMNVIRRWGFAPFAWYRIGAGAAILLISLSF